jgi:hypothetical protein
MVTFVALYPEYGGPARGFRCETCERVTRTESGIKMHLRIKHGIKIQGDLFDANASGVSESRVQQEVSQRVASEK